MPEKYKGESEASTASKKERLKIKMKKLPLFKVPFKRDMKLLRLQMERKEFPFGKEAEKERKRNLKYQKQDKINRNKS